MTIVAAIFAGVLQRVVEMLPEFYCSWSLVTLDILVWLAQFLGFFLNSVCLPVLCILSCAFDSLLGAFWLIFFLQILQFMVLFVPFCLSIRVVCDFAPFPFPFVVLTFKIFV